MNEGGFVWARSPHFTFCSPEPLDDLETMAEERDEEEGERDGEEEEMLLVIPKAQLFKVSSTVNRNSLQLPTEFVFAADQRRQHDWFRKKQNGK